MTKYLIPLSIICFYNSLLFSQSKDDLKLTKKNERIEKRYIHPQSKYISVSGGWVFNLTHTNDPNDFFEQMSFNNSGIFPSIVYEHGIKNNFFAEIGYDYTKQAINLRRDMGDQQAWSKSWSYSSLVEPFIKQKSHNLHFGGGYRLIGKNNFHFVNFHGGLFFGLSNKSNSFMNNYVGNTAYFTEYEEYTKLNYQIQYTLDSYSPISLGAYLGISKEIRLSEEIRFFVKYIHRFGFLPTSKGTYVMKSDDMTFNHDATFTVRGGGSFISGGLKVLLFKKQLTKNE